ncbi:cytochrome c-type biogenesis protein CcmH [Sulfuritortus calidifontis]|uniref:Cytochrome c-type biogenesis protein n=1 Tax=Sulfuritortus calidifontis TaxID=1914471 RepID=A0A4R3JZL5_9PROT|nr:cytochrome c-type biogenesis protein [Sulfuritortus calidifontis]TCS73310.1 cytochrome c-type biogenesis protein CcmH [Sulfuritortus calidifontis]
MKHRYLIALLCGFLALPGHAGEAQPNAENPEIEQRMNKLAEDLRCLVCQNESLAGSRADLAADLRREIREQMQAGKNDQQVIDYLTSRYGDFVLYKPPFRAATLLLWLGPALFIAIGGIVWFVTLRRRRNLQAPQIDEAARRQAARLLAENEDKQ